MSKKEYTKPENTVYVVVLRDEFENETIMTATSDIYDARKLYMDEVVEQSVRKVPQYESIQYQEWEHGKLTFTKTDVFGQQEQ